MRVHNRSIAGLFLILLLSLSGCGGSGGGSGTSASAFVGTYRGTWSQVGPAGGNVEDGTATIAIQESGKVSGTFSDPSGDGSVQGQIQANGSINFTVTFSARTDRFSGTLKLDGENLTGPFGAENALYAGQSPQFALLRFTL